MITSRRSLILSAGALSAATAFSGRPISASSLTDPITREVSIGLAYLSERAADQAALSADLTAAIASGNVMEAQLAYERARPPYEEIEVHASAFSHIDADLDARPYAFAGGETNPAFQGFHRIEALLYRDQDLEAALPWAKQAEVRIKDLQTALKQPDLISEPDYFAGLIALPEEVASKKISSEEETWSDLSLVIFRHNLLGVQSQFMPFAKRLAAVDAARLDAAQLAFMKAEAVFEPYWSGARPTRYSDVRTRERASISQAAYAVRGAMEGAAEALQLL